MAEAPVDVSVIVPVWNDEQRLTACLSALRSQTLPSDRYEIIVADNGSDRSPEPLVRAFGARMITEARLGSYAARNTAVRTARGRVLAFTDADCQPGPDWLRSGLDFVDASAENVFIGGRIDVFPAGTSLTVVEVYDQVATFRQDRNVHEASYVMTANMFVRAATFLSVGFFDDSLKSGGDSEWSARAVRAGVTPVYCHDAVVRHPARGTRAEVRRKLRRLAAGHRDKAPSWGNCWRFSLRHAVPPRRAMLDILQLRHPDIGWATKCLACIFAWEARLYYSWSRLAFQLSKGESPRA
jgi:glycosyltransferase involved in cell wall biosynthesis